MKQARCESYRVVVWPADNTWLIRDEMRRLEAFKRTCEDVAASIRRHVDDVNSVEIEYDTLHVCSFCGAEWTEEGTTGNYCCDADIAEAAARAEVA